MEYPTLKPYKVCENVYAVGGVRRSHPRDSAVYVVIGPEGAVLIDCGSPFGFERRERNLRGLGVEIMDIELMIGTHCHYDHVGGGAELKRRNPAVKIAVHELDAPACESGDADLTCAGWMFRDEFPQFEVDIPLGDGEILRAAGLEFEIIHAPGHTEGSVAVSTVVRGKKIIFTGDCYVPSCERAGYDYDKLIETVEKLLGLGADIVCPGHLGHLVTFPVTQAMKGKISPRIARAVCRFEPPAKIVSGIASFFYEFNVIEQALIHRAR